MLQNIFFHADFIGVAVHEVRHGWIRVSQYVDWGSAANLRILR